CKVAIDTVFEDVLRYPLSLRWAGTFRAKHSEQVEYRWRRFSSFPVRATSVTKTEARSTSVWHFASQAQVCISLARPFPVGGDDPAHESKHVVSFDAAADAFHQNRMPDAREVGPDVHLGILTQTAQALRGPSHTK